jgi:hypothetical protein
MANLLYFGPRKASSSPSPHLIPSIHLFKVHGSAAEPRFLKLWFRDKNEPGFIPCPTGTLDNLDVG